MRRNVSLFTLLLIGIGWMIKNVKIGLIIGLVLGLLISGIGTRSK